MCQFTATYWDNERRMEIPYNCDSKYILASGLCIFHDENYQDKNKSAAQRKQKVCKKLIGKVKATTFQISELKRSLSLYQYIF